MTAAIASLFAAPPEMGVPGVAAAVGPAANTDDIFAGLVSALFDTAEGPASALASTAQSQPPQSLLPQLQVPQASDTIALAPAVSGTKNSSDPGTFASLTSEIDPQGTPLFSAPPMPAPETTSASLENSAAPEHAALADERPLDLPASPADATPQNEALPDASAQTILLLEAETKASDSGNVDAVPDPEPDSATPALSTPTTAARANSPTTARQQKPSARDEEDKQPLIDVLSLSEMAPRLIAQVLAAQVQAEGQQPAVKLDQTVVPAPAQQNSEQSGGTWNDNVPDAPALTGNNFAPTDIAITGLPPVASGANTPTEGTAGSAALPQPDKTGVPNPEDAVERASPETQSISSLSNARAPAANSVEEPRPEHSSSNLRANAYGNGPVNVRPVEQEIDAVSFSENAPTATNPTIPQSQQSSLPSPQIRAAEANAAGVDTPDHSAAITKADTTVSADHQTAAAPDPHSTASEIDKNTTSDPSDRLPIMSAYAVLNSEGDSEPANQPSVAVETAVTSVGARPAAAVARDAADSALAPGSAASPDSSRPTVASRITRTPLRSSTPVNRDDVEPQSQSPASSAPDLVSAAEKSQPVHATDVAQDRDLKADPKPAPTHVAQSASETDTPQPQQPADLAPASASPQPQADRIETATSAPPQSQFAAIDFASPPAGSTHGFDMPFVHTGGPRDQDATVRLAFNAPNVPDSSAFDALALKIASHSSDGDSRFSIRLDPPELGKIEVNLSVDAHGHAQAELSADKPQTLELLQKDASVLERALRDAGLNLSGGLAFSLKGEGRSQAWRDTQNGRSRNLQIGAADAASANAALTARAALAAHAYGLPTSQLDIRV